MIKKTIPLIMILFSMLLMNSCAVSVSVSDPIVGESTEIFLTPTDVSLPTETAVPTKTALPTNTPTPKVVISPTSVYTATQIPTPTSIPIYTELGERANWVAYILGWEVLLCDKSVNEEDLVNGIFLYREDTNQFFCDFEGHIEEPVPEPLPGGYQMVLSFTEFKGLSEMGVEDGFGFAVCGFENHYYPSPSIYSADEIVAMREGGFETYEALRNYKIEYSITVRMWPLTAEQVREQLYDVPEDEMLNFWFQR